MYTVSGTNALKETSWNSTGNLWYDRDIPIALDPPAAGSYLTAYTWFIGQVRQIRIYYQGQDGYVREAAYDFSRGWIKSAAPTIQDFPRAKSGSGLVAVSFPDTDVSGAKLFYQSMDGKLVSYDYQLRATFAQSWQNQDRGFSHSIFENGYKIYTNKCPLNSHRRPRIYTRWGTAYCHILHTGNWRAGTTDILHSRWKIGRNLVDSQSGMEYMEHARCCSTRRFRSILY